MKIIANIPSLAWRYLWHRPLSTAINLLLATLGIASITVLLLVSHQVERAFTRDLASIDAVVGAKGSPLQMILAGVLHVDVPAGNMPLADLQTIAEHPLVAQVIPISVGDSVGGWRIVGTTPDYLALYGAKLAIGRVWGATMEAVLGHEAAHRSGLDTGQSFFGVHGLGGQGEVHGDTPYRVVGVLAPCGCVLDRLALTSTQSVWQVHEKAGADDEADRRALEAEREVTFALVRYRSPLAAVTFPRHVNAGTRLQAAVPAVEVTRLLRMLGVGADVLRGFAAVMVLTAALGVFAGLWQAVRERRGDLALLRLLGAPPRRVAALVLAEGLWLASLAVLLGLALGHGLTGLLGWWMGQERQWPLSGWLWVPVEWWIPLGAWAGAAVAATLPAWAAYRADVGPLLSERS